MLLSIIMLLLTPPAVVVLGNGVGGVGLVGLGAALLETLYCSTPLRAFYSRNMPPSLPLTLRTQGDRRDGIVVIFCGAGGPDDNTDSLKRAIQANDRRLRIRRQVHVYDWRNYSSNLVRAARNAEEIGDMLGRQIAETYHCRGSATTYSIWSIGISAGAFGADALIRAVHRHRHAAGSPAFLRLSLLDPFSSKGMLRLLAGVPEPLGRLANYCEQFMNTDDPVPSTNSPLKYAVCYDVTRSRNKREYSPIPGDSPGHAFPVFYLARNLRRYMSDASSLTAGHDTALRRRGIVHIVD